MGTNSNWSDGPPMTYEAMMETMRRFALNAPKRETWLSTKHYPYPDALHIDATGENFVVAHPSFWLRVEYACRDRNSVQAANLLGAPFLFGGIQIIEIDGHASDSPERVRYLADIWTRLIEAIKVASVELPDWLKAAPKFGRHG